MGMTIDEAIKHGKEQLEIFGGEHREFIEMAIKALEQEPCEDATLKDIFCMGCEYKEPTTKNDLPHCQHTDEEIAKSFIDDVEAVKDQLPTKNGISNRSIIYGDDCISRQAVIDMTGLSEWFDSSDSYNEFVIALGTLPSVTPQKPKTGHWIKYGIPRLGEQHYQCTYCKDYINFGVYSDYYLKAFKYCPICGAKMEVEDGNN